MTEEKRGDSFSILKSSLTRGDLGKAIASVISDYSPGDLKTMQWNFSSKIKKIDPGYRKKLENAINGHMNSTWEKIRLMNQQGEFSQMKETLPEENKKYWTMVEEKCSSDNSKKDRIILLKYLLSGFCMFVLEVPPHPAGMPFPGGDQIQLIDGTDYCPVRTKANDVDFALCPFCPAKQTPDVGYLKPPVGGSRIKKQEFIRDTYEFHHFNG